MNDILTIGASGWLTFPLGMLVVAVTLGFLPGRLLRLIIRLYPKGHPRRDELLAELYAIGYLKRPVWVLEQFETALTDGLCARIREWRRERAARARLALAEVELTRILNHGRSLDQDPLRVMFRRDTAQWVVLQAGAELTPEQIEWFIRYQGEPGDMDVWTRPQRRSLILRTRREEREDSRPCRIASLD